MDHGRGDWSPENKSRLVQGPRGLPGLDFWNRWSRTGCYFYLYHFGLGNGATESDKCAVCYDHQHSDDRSMTAGALRSTEMHTRNICYFILRPLLTVIACLRVFHVWSQSWSMGMRMMIKLQHLDESWWRMSCISSNSELFDCTVGLFT